MTTHLSYGLLNCIFSGPAAFKSFVVGLRLDVIGSQPLKESLCNSIKRNSDIASRIVVLLIRACPLAVFRGVIAIAVNAFKGCFWKGLGSHVGKEGFKGVPAVTDFYTAPPIVFEGSVIRILAAPFHSYPCSVFGRLVHPVFGHCLDGNVSVQTTTAVYMSIIKMVYYYLVGIATIALAIPIDSIVGSVRYSGGNKPTESFSCKVLSFWHTLIIPYNLDLSNGGMVLDV